MVFSPQWLTTKTHRSNGLFYVQSVTAVPAIHPVRKILEHKRKKNYSYTAGGDVQILLMPWLTF